eukprot:4403037-Pyramimonas_sp.AAC.1
MRRARELATRYVQFQNVQAEVPPRDEASLTGWGNACEDGAKGGIHGSREDLNVTIAETEHSHF